MLRSRIIPSLLMRDKGLVKTRQFKDEKYVGDPLNAVKIFNEKEVDELAIFDISATAAGTGPNMALLSKIAVQSRMPLCYGGGITSAAEAAEIVHIGQAIMNQEGKANNIDYFTNTTFNYPTMAEAYRIASVNGLNRISRERRHFEDKRY